jgi:hypothetical protein
MAVLGNGGLNISLMPRGTIQGTRDSVDQIADSAEDFPMNTSDRFLRFAAECEVMAKFSRTPENRTVWSGLAQRWTRSLNWWTSKIQMSAAAAL